MIKVLDKGEHPSPSNLENIKEEFEARFPSSNSNDITSSFAVVRSPGRVNLIGEHIDYCGFAVLPMTIKKDINIAIRVVRDGKHELDLMNVNTKKYPETLLSTDLNDINVCDASQWTNYFLAGVKGVYEWAARKCKDVPLAHISMQCLVNGMSLPSASGLSSSSALVVAASLCALYANGLLDKITRQELAQLCVDSEKYVGVQGGGMDQTVMVCTVHPSPSLIHFDPISVRNVSSCCAHLNESVVYVVANSLAESKKGEEGSGYNMRVLECTLAAKILAKCLISTSQNSDGAWNNVSNFRDVIGMILENDNSNKREVCQNSLTSMIEACEKHLKDDSYTLRDVFDILRTENCSETEKFWSEILPSNLLKYVKHLSTEGDKISVSNLKLKSRALHVFNEASRVYEFVRVMENCENLEQIKSQLGCLMNASHESCAHLYECSHPDLDTLVEISKKGGAFGARLTGAGWGGCIVALVDANKKDEFIQYLKEEYFIKEKKCAREVLNTDSFIFASSASIGAGVYV